MPGLATRIFKRTEFLNLPQTRRPRSLYGQRRKEEKEKWILDCRSVAAETYSVGSDCIYCCQIAWDGCWVRFWSSRLNGYTMCQANMRTNVIVIGWFELRYMGNTQWNIRNTGIRYLRKYSQWDGNKRDMPRLLPRLLIGFWTLRIH
jgi:hypothetical protein